MLHQHQKATPVISLRPAASGTPQSSKVCAALSTDHGGWDATITNLFGGCRDLSRTFSWMHHWIIFSDYPLVMSKQLLKWSFIDMYS